MIVKNEEEMLSKTLPVLSSVVDEIILVDTGSSDRTIEIAKECGARVFNFPWINDFSAARNESLKHAKGEWIIWIDADEMIKTEEFEDLKKFLAEAKADAYNIKICECEPPSFIPCNFYFRPKIFRNGRGIHFERPINEHPFDADGKAINGDLVSSVSTYHWGGHLAEKAMEKKWNRNINLLVNMLEGNASDKHGHFLLANNLRQAGRYEEAVAEYEKAIALDTEKQFAAAAAVKLGWCFYNLKRAKEAYRAALRALELDQNEVAAYNILGAIALACKKNKEALEMFKKAETSEFAEERETAKSFKEKIS
ncbi:hypothetical protein A2276_05610 [candidate division WOR-1 bacterium RIFOXYA12_FULL_43_27]|uniref:Glycosyltransferase 2-like domain-containing protein n=1 Tax=candidate division WOR-1 bacterium RIFOXYC2_FULL_46_14 TaxID=1802587 RepID=A0A1F4U3N7_UNCSA|nr:MAG: hypothetical protein A2276_05610 [candidate division WOR-1 bacterium RIFOXYA12_FULL_43_27]OGC20142.1 MAG: hypothetical protein A2292_03615 [candidate division WOR-1 bacterium RIFOXYB2_FULL_46_45]OGC32121.1 MAG: hypothetical protein A2232_07835 [candidate division WOR-1 bacterium RIFOXYA2_FULL_46_56]OGC39522.1 MAG: hypothetical protein A2438_08200 [candidate division WOR-1 bacterium RIFOXYC2_FULL_46_14]